MKILQICKSWGMTEPNDTRHWIADIEKELEKERQCERAAMKTSIGEWIEENSEMVYDDRRGKMEVIDLKEFKIFLEGLKPKQRL